MYDEAKVKIGKVDFTKNCQYEGLFCSVSHDFCEACYKAPRYSYQQFIPLLYLNFSKNLTLIVSQVFNYCFLRSFLLFKFCLLFLIIFKGLLLRNLHLMNLELIRCFLLKGSLNLYYRLKKAKKKLFWLNFYNSHADALLHYQFILIDSFSIGRISDNNK